jgi:hypothetical protein
VFVAAFAPDEGETLGDAENDSKDSVLSSALAPLHYPTDDSRDPGVEFAIDPAKLRDAFAADISPRETTLLAATQRPSAPARRSPSLKAPT